VHLGACAITSPVLEFVTGMYSPLSVSRHSPLIKSCNFLGVTPFAGGTASSFSISVASISLHLLSQRQIHELSRAHFDMFDPWQLQASFSPFLAPLSRL
jgi:hypothetical protein